MREFGDTSGINFNTSPYAIYTCYDIIKDSMDYGEQTKLSAYHCQLWKPVKPLLSDHLHVKQDVCGFSDRWLLIQLLLHESSAESSMSFLGHFHSAIRNPLSVATFMSPEWIVT